MRFLMDAGRDLSAIDFVERTAGYVKGGRRSRLIYFLAG
jgi:hypothetical protein